MTISDLRGVPWGDALRGVSMYITTTGLILRETKYKETSKILNVLTADEGRITVSAKGARRKGSKTAAATQLLAFSEMTLLQSRGRWTLTEANCIELFQGLRDDIELLSLGSYFAEILESVSDEDVPSPEILSAGLNALYALSTGMKAPELVKAAFEMRIMRLSGFSPLLDECSKCGRADIVEPVLDIYGGAIFCGNCKNGDENAYAKLCDGSLDAMRYIIECDAKKMFSFSLSEDAGKRLSAASEKYLSAQLERNFHTLEYYKSIKL